MFSKGTCFFLSKCCVILLFVISGTGCTTPHQRDVEFVQTRVAQLRGLEKYPSTVCDIETYPTPTARARYIQLSPTEADQLKDETWKYKWRQTENRCEISGGSDLKAVKMQKGIVEAALCLPLQVFFVNSPFDEVKIGSSAVNRENNLIHVGEKGSELGYYLDMGNTTVLTRTRSKGELSAHYSDRSGEWLPDQIEHKTSAIKILLEAINYSEQRIGSRRMLDSLWISVGTDVPRRHSQILVRNCQAMR